MKASATRKVRMQVPVDAMYDFAEKINELNMTNEIKGTNDEGDITVEIHYEPEERDEVMELTEFLEDFRDEQDEDEDEEDEK